jgi:hypothetical protein
VKVGDLVRMKSSTWAVTTARRVRPNHVEDTGIVYSIAGRGLKVLMPDGSIKVGLMYYWEVVNSGSESYY